MYLQFKDTKGENEIIQIKNIDLLHFRGKALVRDMDDEVYEIEIERVLQVTEKRHS